MATYLLWAIAGFVLIIVELMSGTFYLLVLGIAALVGALAAYFDAALWVQVIIASVVALAGIFAVRRWWGARPKAGHSSNSLDIGQTVVLESWVNQAAGMARVRYRGSTWDAKVDSGAAIDDVLIIKSQENGVLQVSAKH
ncbi:MAG TPA: NfeD family protein [Usitatibacteraceae bacterium]